MGPIATRSSAGSWAPRDITRAWRMTNSTDRGAMAEGFNMGKFLESYGILIVVVVMMLVLAAIRPDVFLSAQNLTNILKQNASLALLALGMLVVIITAGIDLSVGSTMALS